MKDSLVSVIVPIYNVEKYIYKCLSSIKNQTYREIEVLLVDDGSPDKSGEIAKKFCHNDNRFRYFYKNNGGLSSARNYGIENANGEYIYFLDSDDWIGPNYIEELVRGFDEDTEVVIANYTLVDDIIHKSYVPYSKEAIQKSYVGTQKEKQIFCRHLNAYPQYGFEIKNTIMPVWKNMYRYDLLTSNAIKFVSEKLVGSEDYVFNCEVYFLAKKITVITANEYYHLIVPGSLSRKFYPNELDRVVYKYNYVHKYILNHSGSFADSYIDALDDDMCREIVITINNFIKDSSIRDSKRIETMLERPECQVLYKKKKVNIEKKYLFLLYVIKHCNSYFTFLIFSILNKPYVFYRKLLSLKER